MLLLCSRRLMLPPPPGPINSKKTPYFSLLKSCRKHKKQPGSPQKLNTSKLPYSEKLFLLFHCKDQNVFVGIFGLLNLAITNQHSRSQCILKFERKHCKKALETTNNTALSRGNMTVSKAQFLSGENKSR